MKLCLCMDILGGWQLIQPFVHSWPPDITMRDFITSTTMGITTGWLQYSSYSTCAYCLEASSVRPHNSIRDIQLLCSANFNVANMASALGHSLTIPFSHVSALCAMCVAACKSKKVSVGGLIKELHCILLDQVGFLLSGTLLIRSVIAYLSFHMPCVGGDALFIPLFGS